MSQIVWENRGRPSREMKKFLYRLNRKDYQESLDIISKGVNNLEQLARLSVELEPNRRKQSRCKVLNILRDLSSSIYRALRSSIICNDSHDLSLELATKFIDINHGTEEKDIFRDAQFMLAISYEIEDGQVKRRFWDEVDINTIHTSNAITSKPNPPTVMRKSMKRVSFGMSQNLPFFKSSKTAPDLKKAMLSLSGPAIDTAFIKSPDDSCIGRKLSPLNLCRAVRNKQGARPVCYGHLIDDQCHTRHYQVCPRLAPTNSDKWSIVTLDDILECKKGLRPLVSLEEKLRLAVAVAFSVLQLSKTPWLSEMLTRKDVHFFKRGDMLSYDQPFLLKSLPETSYPAIGTTSIPGCSPMQRNPTLFALGILLLEIILGSTLDQHRQANEQGFDGDDLGIIRDSLAAHRLLEQRVALINPVYKTVVERCIGCTESKGLDEDVFRENVYNSVVMELETILDYTKLRI